ncbi:MAG: pilus assembly protein TadG-related protein, partial [Kiritimatiellaeota bacterium]|nr:pilus assembly protein TadG-related protein [Kiritimatiellota bacterium]
MKTNRKGQVAIFVLLALVILLVAVLWSVDIRRVVFTKDAVQAAGDSAALAAARWQATSLNLIGELNEMHIAALALDEVDDAAIDAITNAQARLCLVGPMTALSAAQVAGKLGGIPRNEGYEAIVLHHANVVEQQYRRLKANGEMTVPEPYEGAWTEYADMLRAVAEATMCVGPDNAQFFRDGTFGHTLYDRSFYQAIATRWWCWFFPDRLELLRDYTGYGWWPALPDDVEHPNYSNSEFFGLGLEPKLMMPRDTPPQTYYCYDIWQWGAWDAIREPFPATGPVRPEYDYAGADVVTRSEKGMARLMPGARQGGDTITWVSAAKPFGYVELASGRRVAPMVSHDGMVVPAFRD